MSKPLSADGIAFDERELLTGLRDLLRGYERHHREKADAMQRDAGPGWTEDGDGRALWRETLEKCARNRQWADRIDARLKLLDEDARMNPPTQNFRDDLAACINRWSIENGSNTPDYMLADFCIDAMCALDRAVNKREHWHGRPNVLMATSVTELPVGAGNEPEPPSAGEAELPKFEDRQ